MIAASTSVEAIKNLPGVVGGNITLPDPVTEKGYLLHGIKALSMVDKRKNLILVDIYKGKLHWNQDTGLFTITDLQRHNSGIYTVDSKREQYFSRSYNLTVYGKSHLIMKVTDRSPVGCNILGSSDATEDYVFHIEDRCYILIPLN